ncbi:MAG: hypothetical protein AAF628_23175 [Planctomycetota bacterium]
MSRALACLLWIAGAACGQESGKPRTVVVPRPGGVDLEALIGELDDGPTQLRRIVPAWLKKLLKATDDAPLPEPDVAVRRLKKALAVLSALGGEGDEEPAAGQGVRFSGALGKPAVQRTLVASLLSTQAILWCEAIESRHRHADVELALLAAYRTLARVEQMASVDSWLTEAYRAAVQRSVGANDQQWQQLLLALGYAAEVADQGFSRLAATVLDDGTEAQAGAQRIVVQGLCVRLPGSSVEQGLAAGEEIVRRLAERATAVDWLVLARAYYRALLVAEGDAAGARARELAEVPTEDATRDALEALSDHRRWAIVGAARRRGGAAGARAGLGAAWAAGRRAAVVGSLDARCA